MGEEKYVPTIDDLIELPELGDVQISPGGAYVAYVVRTPNWKENEYIAQIWLVGVGGGESRQLTYANRSSATPRWSPFNIQLSMEKKRDRISL
jgi:dipeptidyl aminopeptidase/acylaminoacyl peptidase